MTDSRSDKVGYDYSQGDDEGDATYALRIVDRCEQLERELAEAGEEIKYWAERARVAPSHVATNGQHDDVVEGLRVIASRRGCKIQQGDVLALERAIDALLSPPSGEHPHDMQEWINHLDLHLTEHDERHAGLALRAAWPRVRDYFNAALKAAHELRQQQFDKDQRERLRLHDRAIAAENALESLRSVTPSSTEAISGVESIPEYFAKPQVVEGLAAAHPVLLIRQMANEILRLRSVTPSATLSPETLKRIGSFLWSYHGENEQLAWQLSNDIDKLLGIHRADREVNRG